MAARAPWILAKCSRCGTEWQMMPTVYRHRTYNAHGHVYCSKKCSARMIAENREAMRTVSDANFRLSEKVGSIPTRLDEGLVRRE